MRDSWGTILKRNSFGGTHQFIFEKKQSYSPLIHGWHTIYTATYLGDMGHQDRMTLIITFLYINIIASPHFRI